MPSALILPPHQSAGLMKSQVSWTWLSLIKSEHRCRLRGGHESQSVRSPLYRLVPASGLA